MSTELGALRGTRTPTLFTALVSKTSVSAITPAAHFKLGTHPWIRTTITRLSSMRPAVGRGKYRNWWKVEDSNLGSPQRGGWVTATSNCRYANLPLKLWKPIGHSPTPSYVGVYPCVSVQSPSNCVSMKLIETTRGRLDPRKKPRHTKTSSLDRLLC